MALGDLVVKLSADVAQFSSDMGRAVHIANRNSEQMANAFSKVSSAAAAIGVSLGAVFGVSAMTSMVSGIVKATAALDDMAERTGASVEKLSALAQVAAIGGHGTELLETSMIRLAKALGATDEKGKAAREALESIGLNAADLKSLDPADALVVIAKRLEGYRDGMGKTALAMALWGKSGAALLPLLKDLATDTSSLRKITEEEAAEAERLEKAWKRLTLQGEEFKKSIVLSMIPSLNDIVEAMLSARKVGDGFWGSMFEGAKKATQAMMGWNAAGDLKNINKKISDITDTIAAHEFGPMQNEPAIQMRVKQLKADVAELVKQKKLVEDIFKIEQPGAISGKGPDKPKSDVPFAAGDDTPAVNKELERAQALMKKQIEQFNHDYWASIEERNEVEVALVAAGQIRVLEEFTKAEKLMLQQIFDEIDAIQERDIAVEQAAGLAANKGKSNFQELEEQTKKNAEAARELGMSFTSAFEDAVLNGKKMSEVLQGLAKDVARVFLRRGVTEPLAAFAGDLFKSFIPKYDMGTDFVPHTGLAVVHRGEQIIPAGGGRGGEININFGSGPPTDPQAIAAVLLPAIQSIVRGEVGGQFRPGGLFNPA